MAMGLVLARVVIVNSLWEQLTRAGDQEEGEGGALDSPLCQGERDISAFVLLGSVSKLKPDQVPQPFKTQIWQPCSKIW